MLITNIYRHIKYTKILKKIYKEEDLLDKMGKMLNSNIKIDWVGRVYTVLNPNLLDKSEQIFEPTSNGYDNTKFIEKWVMERFIIISNFIKVNNLFDLLTYDIKKIDDYDNYLLILSPITWVDFKSSIKKLSFYLISIIIVIIIYLIFINK